MLDLFLSGMLAEEAAEAVEEAEETVAETAAAAPSGWWYQFTKKFVETPSIVWIAVLVLVALGAILLAVSKSGKKWNARMVSFGALSMALSFVLSCARLYRMPSGGSITPASMLPLMLFAAAYGLGPGLLTGLAYGVLQFFQGGETFSLLMFALDYLLAFAALGLAGLADVWKGKKWGLYAAMIIAILGRLCFATLSGIVLWDTAPWASLVYNFTYLGPDALICLVLAPFVAPRVMKLMRTGT
ncbi:MAG: energy-coupled thiamine transporter ThiT [Clostridia bacterium]|nr:energy-coupled thiamine transporter ThiT [Clostridia bacterium]